MIVNVAVRAAASAEEPEWIIVCGMILEVIVENLAGEPIAPGASAAPISPQTVDELLQRQIENRPCFVEREPQHKLRAIIPQIGIDEAFDLRSPGILYSAPTKRRS